MGALIIFHQKAGNLVYIVPVLFDYSVANLFFKKKMNKPHSEQIYIFELPLCAMKAQCIFQNHLQEHQLLRFFKIPP